MKKHSWMKKITLATILTAMVTTLVPTSGIIPAFEATKVEAATAKQYTATANLNLRAGASTKHKSLVTIPKGKAVTFVSASGSWYKVKYGTKTGYVSSKYLKVVTPKKVTKNPAVKKPTVKWMAQSQATTILRKTLDKNNQLVSFDNIVIEVDFYNKSDAKAGMGIDSRTYFSAIDVKPTDFGQKEYDLYKVLLKQMDLAISAFSETQLGVGTSDSKRMTADIKKFTAYSRKDDKTLKTYSGKTYEFWQMGGLVMIEFKK
jgi:uncharacterized protein YraI